jgi:hypothetical protein
LDPTFWPIPYETISDGFGLSVFFCQPASANLRAQQQRFDRWRKEFNEERPHEAIGQGYPATVHQASSRRLDEAVKTQFDEPGDETKHVSGSGFICLEGKSCFIGEAFAGVKVAVEQDEACGLSRVRSANVNLRSLKASTNARFRPTPTVGRSGLPRRKIRTRQPKCYPCSRSFRARHTRRDEAEDVAGVFEFGVPDLADGFLDQS